jgi:hypothetical protein
VGHCMLAWQLQAGPSCMYRGEASLRCTGATCGKAKGRGAFLWYW